VTVAALAGIVLLPAARAAERITLTNGFDLICHHHAQVDGDAARVRVYPKADEANYVELRADSITGVETVPDPPAEAVPSPKEPKPAEASAARPALHDAALTAADLHQLLAKAGQEHNVAEDLLASVVKAESGGNARAVSRTGARGLMQLMPGTALQLGVADSFAPEDNVRGGSAYLDWLLTRYHDNIALALAAYNAGPAAVDKYRGIPPYHETRVYVARVIHEFNRRVLARAKTGTALATAQRVSGPGTAYAKP
jgi:soluble lytic murein transglycosylase-like protein